MAGVFALIHRRRDRIAVAAALLAPLAVCAGLIPVRTTCEPRLRPHRV
jgi:hypothetical protein